MNKKYKIILAISLIITLVIVALLIFTRDKQTPIIEEETAGTLPDSGDQGDNLPSQGLQQNPISKLTDDGLEVFDYWIKPSTNEVFYIGINGNVYEARTKPNTEISSQGITAINNIKPSMDGEEILVSFGNPNSPSWGMFSMSDRSWRPLPSSIKEISWGENNEKLIAIIEGINDVILASIDLSVNTFSEGSFEYETLVRNFKMRDVGLNWVDDSILISEKPASFYSSRIWMMDQESLNVNLLTEQTKSLTTRWLGDQDIVFMFSEDGFYILNKNLENEVPVPFETIPTKCNSSDEYVYCFVPQGSNVFSGESALDDYYKNKLKTNDVLLKINKENVNVERVNISGNVPNIDAKNVNYIDNKIFFINKKDGGLYSVVL
ncbi:MAG: hypothetical protein WDZ80_04945 [Candidatus Paceibacterota bacterium]